MANQYESSDMAQTLADMIRSDPGAAEAALKIANTVEVACLLGESVDLSQLSDHGQAMSPSRPADQIHKTTGSPG